MPTLPLQPAPATLVNSTTHTCIAFLVIILGLVAFSGLGRKGPPESYGQPDAGLPAAGLTFL